MVPRSFAPPTVELPGSKNTPAPPASSTPNGVSFPDTNTGIVVGGGPILRTTDGGVTWERLSSGLPEWGWFYAVSFSSANIGTVIRTYGSIYGTTDGGKTWTWQFNALSQLNAVSFADGNTGFAVGDGAGMRTIDGGASWTYYPSLYNCHGISFANPKTGIAVGSRGILRTTDGGATWLLPYHSLPVDIRFLRVSFSDSHNATAVGYGGILRTTDAGATWVVQLQSSGVFQA